MAGIRVACWRCFCIPRAIDNALNENAASLGSPLAEGLNAYDEPPLRVLFEILDDDRIVRILEF